MSDRSGYVIEVIRITRFGVVILTVAVVSVLLAIFASGTAQVVGFVVAVLVGLLIAGEGLSGWGTPMGAARKAEMARRYATDRQATTGSTAEAEPVDDLWARERARRRGT
jgi:hypothetical protein